MAAIPLALLLLAAQPEIVVTARARPPLPGPAVPDAALARMRGRLALPNGLDVAIGIDIQTRVDGVLVLHTIYASEGAAPGVRVFTDGTDAQPLAPATVTVSSPAVPGAPLLVVDRSPTGTTIVPTESRAPTTVNLVNGDPGTWLDASGQIPVPVTRNGPPVTIAPGAVTLTGDERGAVVTLDAPGLRIQQLIGQATGVVVANSGDNRTIETVSSVNVDLQGLSPTLLSGVFAAQRAVLEAFTR